jgi:predicted transcriptional regulator
MSGISRDEWLSALNESDVNDPAALSMAELSALLKIARSTAQLRIDRLVKEGKAARTSKVVTTDTGRRYRITAYKLLKVAKAKRA